VEDERKMETVVVLVEFLYLFHNDWFVCVDVDFFCVFLYFFVIS